MKATFRNMQSGQLVEATFPLHPMLVEFAAADGTTGQMETATFTSTHVQQLPELPALVVTDEATEADLQAAKELLAPVVDETT